MIQAVPRSNSDPVDVIRDRKSVAKHIEIIGVKNENIEIEFRKLIKTVRHMEDSIIKK